MNQHFFTEMYERNRPYSSFIIPFLSAVLLLLAIFLLAKSTTEFATLSKPDVAYNSITIEGEGEATAVPDTATFSFSVVEERTTVPEAQKAVEDKTKAIVDYLKQQGIEEKYIKNDAYNVYPKYNYPNCSGFELDCPQPEIYAYEVYQTVSVKVIESGKAGDLISGVGQKGATNLSGLTFTVRDEQMAKDEARKKAIENAKMKAAQLSKELGVTLVRVISFYEMQDYGYPMYEGLYGMGGMEGSVAKDMAMPATLPQGENTYKTRVSVSYEIR